jgi:predicted ATPase
VAQALTELLQPVEYIRASGHKLALPRRLGSIAEAYCAMGDPTRGLGAISEAFAEMDETGERLYESELHRIKGELLLTQDSSNADQAERSFRDAIEVARRQRARSFELRATMRLARLLDQRGNRDRARAMLAEIYNWFTEGFDTADLKEARALLDQLGG